MLKKFARFAAVTAAVAVVSAMTVSAAPYKDFQIGAGETVIECEDFDSEDVNDVNSGEGDHTYRPEEGTQTGAGGRDGDASFNVGWTAGGEWLQYTVNVTQAGKYNLSIWMGGDNPPGNSLDISYDGALVGTQVIPNIGWSAYELVNMGDVDMTEGTHVIRIDIPNGSVNLDAIVVTQLEAAATVEPADEGGAAEEKPVPATGDNGLVAPFVVILASGVALLAAKKKARA